MEPTKQQIEAAAVFLTERLGYLTERVVTFGTLSRLLAEYAEMPERTTGGLRLLWPTPVSVHPWRRIQALVDPNSVNPDAEWLEFIKSVNKLEE